MDKSREENITNEKVEENMILPDRRRKWSKLLIIYEVVGWEDLQQRRRNEEKCLRNDEWKSLGLIIDFF